MNGWLQLTEPVEHFFLGVFVFLMVASAFVWAKDRLRPFKNGTELKARIRTWWLILNFLFFAIGFGPLSCVLFFAWISYLSFREYCNLIHVRQIDSMPLFYAYASIPLHYYFIYTDWYNMFTILIPVYLFLMIPLRMVIVGETKDYLKSASTIHFGLMMAVYSISHLCYLIRFPLEKNPQGGGAGLLLFAFFLTEINDVFQYIWGKILGKRKVIPRVSPNKTVEGLLGGIVSTCALSVLLAPHLTPLSTFHAVCAGLIIGIGGFFGDVAISAIKRDLGVKDSGTLLPGHGGILDRVDSLTFTAPLFFHFIRYFYY